MKQRRLYTQSLIDWMQKTRGSSVLCFILTKVGEAAKVQDGFSTCFGKLAPGQLS
jgi:hypothetical protein